MEFLKISLRKNGLTSLFKEFRAFKESDTKKEHKSKLLSPDIFWWGGGLPREGVGAKSSLCPSKPRKSIFFGGISRDFAGVSRRCPKSLRKNSLRSFFDPYYLELESHSGYMT